MLNNSHNVYLASSSPRRRELLTQLGVTFELLPVAIDETPRPAERPRAYVQRLAEEKAEAGLGYCRQPWPVLGTDTIVVIDEQILGKPIDADEGRNMLLQLSGRTHQVMTAVALKAKDYCQTRLVCTDVTFKTLSGAEIDAYWATGEPADKAGGYGIQGIGGKFVKHIAGSYFAVVGLPLLETEQLIADYY